MATRASDLGAGREGYRAGGAAAPDSRSIGELLRDLASDSTRLVRDEIALARTEATDKLKQVGIAVAMMAVAGVLAIPALVLVLEAAVRLLSNVMWDWVADLLVAAIVLVTAFVLLKVGQGKLSASNLAPERTAANLRRDVNLVQEKVS